MKNLLLLSFFFLSAMSISQLELSAEYRPDCSYNWYHNQFDLGINTNTLHSIGKDVTGEYKVRIANSCDTIYQSIAITKTKDNKKYRLGRIDLKECETKLSDIYTEEWYQKLESQLEFIIFPNPTKEIINLRVYRGNSENYQVTIYDQLGKIILQKKSKAEDQIDIPYLSPGIYIFEVLNDKTKKCDILSVQ